MEDVPLLWHDTIVATRLMFRLAPNIPTVEYALSYSDFQTALQCPSINWISLVKDIQVENTIHQG